MDSRPRFVRSAIEPGRPGLDLESSVDCRKHGALLVALDHRSIAPRHGAVGMGEMANRCGRAAARSVVLRSRLRASRQGRFAHAVRTLPEHRLSDGNGLDFSVSSRHGGFDNAVAGVDRAAHLLCDLSGAAGAARAGVRGGQVSANDRIVFEDVSKFYGEILGVNRVNLSIPPGVTSLVGPNGSGKTTLMNLMTGLVHPTRGRIQVLGLHPDEPEKLFRMVGYSTQFDAFPKGLSGFQFVYSYLRLAGNDSETATQLAWSAIDRVNLREAAARNVGGYSKGMRQRIRLAQALCHNPRVLVLDEPLNGLDPLARAEMIELFRLAAADGCYVIISSHILHEVDAISDQVILLSNGYVVAEGQIQGVRNEIREHPAQILIRCNHPRDLASKMMESEHTIEVRIHNDEHGLLIKTKDADRFYLALNHIATNGIEIESVAPADDDVNSVYEYLIGNDEVAR